MEHERRPPRRTPRPPHPGGQPVRRTPPTQQAPPEPSRPHPLRRSAIWVAGVVGTAIGSAVTAFVAALVNPLLDPAAVLDRFSSDPPVHVVSAIVYADHGWVSAEPLTDPQVAAYDDVSFTTGSTEQYMESIGAWPRDYEGIALVLQSKRSKPVQILDMEPKIVACHAVPTSTLVVTSPQGGDNDPHVGVDLDNPKPTFIDTSVPKGQPRDYFASHPLSIAPGGILTMQIDAYATDRACEWRIQADLLVDDAKESVVLDTGTPFRIAGGSPTYARAYAAKELWPDLVQAPEGRTFGPVDVGKLCVPDCRFPLANTPF